MGLPQTEQSHEALSAPTCSLSQSLPVYATSHDSDGLNRGSEGGICSSIGEFDRKKSLEPLEFTDDSCRFHGTPVVTLSSAHGSTSYAAEKKNIDPTALSLWILFRVPSWSAQGKAQGHNRSSEKGISELTS